MMHLYIKTQGSLLCFIVNLVILSTAAPPKGRTRYMHPRELLQEDVVGSLPSDQGVKRLGNSWIEAFRQTHEDLTEKCCQTEQHCCMRKVEECCILGLPCCSTGLGYVSNMCQKNNEQSCKTLENLKRLCCIRGAWQPFCVQFQQASSSENFVINCERDFKIGERPISTKKNNWKKTEVSSPVQNDDILETNASGENADDDEDTNSRDRLHTNPPFPGTFKDDIKFEDSPASETSVPNYRYQTGVQQNKNTHSKIEAQHSRSTQNILNDMLLNHPLKRRYSHEFEDRVDPETTADKQPAYGWSLQHFNWGQGGK